ncbi:hypothetical protein BU23DRAFT_638723 [Bimuria novae-zelandiae CBS 107.79]|uniref:Rhodopsin domain-containing protein n=1 Tax=Bimuria novae-zelandiae CBS 107.79 TaxID=1447943 RepID=A0A6A5VB57_9PLEO|nr:hypothetical protein BU23DRAFT_638723 [Bimuria novae-zelandiae CBS 107.79]
MLKLLMVNNCAYAFGQVTVKISLCLLYCHLFISSRLHRIIDITIGYSVLWGVAFVGVAIFSCRPIHAFWDFSLQALPTTYCVNNRAWYLGQAVPNILTDILVLCMPIKQIWALKLGKKSKLALVFIFSLGIFVCVISVIRVVSLFAIDKQESYVDSCRDRQLEFDRIRHRGYVWQPSDLTAIAELVSPKALYLATDAAIGQRNHWWRPSWQILGVEEER